MAVSHTHTVCLEQLVCCYSIPPLFRASLPIGIVPAHSGGPPRLAAGVPIRRTMTPRRPQQRHPMRTNRSKIEALILMLVIITLATMTAVVPSVQNLALLITGATASLTYLGVIRWHQS